MGDPVAINHQAYTIRKKERMESTSLAPNAGKPTLSAPCQQSEREKEFKSLADLSAESTGGVVV